MREWRNEYDPSSRGLSKAGICWLISGSEVVRRRVGMGLKQSVSLDSSSRIICPFGERHGGQLSKFLKMVVTELLQVRSKELCKTGLELRWVI